jgi:hypothetical protein
MSTRKIPLGKIASTVLHPEIDMIYEAQKRSKPREKRYVSRSLVKKKKPTAKDFGELVNLYISLGYPMLEANRLAISSLKR